MKKTIYIINLDTQISGKLYKAGEVLEALNEELNGDLIIYKVLTKKEIEVNEDPKDTKKQRRGKNEKIQ